MAVALGVNGGILGPANTPSISSASGLWTWAEQYRAQRNGSWPVFAVDPYFDYVTLLLHGNGTNGAQNNTFLDSSTNNFTITRNGNTTQGTFTPFGSNWSNYFDPSGDYLTATKNAAYEIGSGDFTVEAWIFPTEGGSLYNSGVFSYGASSSLNGYLFGITGSNAGGTLNRVMFEYNYDGTLYTSTSGVTLNAWNHIAVSRSGSNIYVFLNGNLQSTTSTSKTANTNAGDVSVIGSESYDPGSTNRNFRGYISNLRLVKGTAVYTSAFTPPTAPLTAITNTSLLTCQSNRFIDNSTNAFTITRNGDVSVQRFSPFNPTAAYSAATIGGSGYFDGSGDYLTAPNNTALDLSTGDFTAEVWFYPTQANQSGAIFNRHNGNYASPTDFQYGVYMSSGNLVVRPYQGSTDYTTVVGAAQINAWNHAALVRTGNTFYGFLNGVRGATSQTISGALNNSTWATYLGAALSSSLGNDFFTGYMGGVRITKGGALYTGSTYTVPTAPLTTSVSSGTVSLLANYTNGGIFDNSMMNDLETVGNAQISTAQSKFGGGSIYFDGSGDNLFARSSPNLDMGAGNWTIECFVYIISRTTNYPIVFSNNRGSWTTDAIALCVSNADNAAYNDKFVFAWNNGGFTSPSAGTSQLLVANATNATATWYHFAVVRNGTSVKMYRNGTEVASATISAAATFNWGFNGALLGGGNWDGAQSNINGYIDEFRITKGYARYTANFTAPTAPFADQ